MSSMQHEVLLTNAVMTITQNLKEYDIITNITSKKFGCGSACPELVEVAALGEANDYGK